jgi:hypothetical protein
MEGGTEVVTPVAETAAAWESIFRSALDRLAASPVSGHLRASIHANASHDVYRVQASLLSRFAAEDRVPESLSLFASQYLILLEAEAVDLIPEEIRIGPNVLSPVSAVQGLLLPSVVRGKDPSGTPRELRAALLVPGFVALPTHVSKVGGAQEVVVYFGSSAVVCALYNAPGDALLLDVVRRS